MAEKRVNRIKAASEALQVHFSDLTILLKTNPLTVSAKLYSFKILSRDELDKIRSSSSDSMEKALDIITSVTDRIKVDPDVFDTFCKVLQSDSSTELQAGVLQDEYLKQLDDLQVSEKRTDSTNCCSQLQASFLAKLKLTLEGLKNSECDNEAERKSVDDALKIVIRGFISNSQKSSSSLDHVKAHLIQLHKDECLITNPSLFNWAEQYATDLYKESLHEEELSSTNILSSSHSEKPPLFSKPVVYHASLCCRAVTTCDAGDYQKFFKDRTKVPGHSFSHVSISRSKQDRFLIATQEGEESIIYYFAFQGELSLEQWPKRFRSFKDGIQAQSEHFPVRFLVELLGTGKHRIVLTGFSFGGLVACAVAAQVWHSSYISSQHLQENLVCITFAQPHLEVPQLEDIARDCPSIRSTIHCIYYDEDLIPRLARILDHSCSQSLAKLESAEDQPEVKMKIPLKEPPNNPFKDPVTQTIFRQLQLMQNKVDVTVAVKELKAILPDICKYLKTTASAIQSYSTHYLLSCPEGSSVGLTFHQLNIDDKALSSHLMPCEVDKLHKNLFLKHNLDFYSQKMYRGFIEKPPGEYVIPSSSCTPTPLINLQPAASNHLQVDEYGSELAIVFEGSNLWFCYKISIDGLVINVKAPESNGNCIRHNVEKKASTVRCLKDGECVKVTLHNHFCKSFTSKVSIIKKEYPMSVRQQQLAKLTPSKVIELAYMSALLEHHPHNILQSNSAKVTVISHFLENVVQVVPLESIAYAMSYCSYDKAKQCAEALVSTVYSEDLSSLLMVDGLYQSVNRLDTGVYPNIADTLIKDAVYKFNVQYHNTVDPQEYRQTNLVVDEHHLTLLVRDKDYLARSVTRHSWNDLKLKFNVDNIGDRHIASDDLRGIIRGMYENVFSQCRKTPKFTKVICGLSIQCLYPISTSAEMGTQELFGLQSPIGILHTGKKKLASLCKHSLHKVTMSQSSRSLVNSQMLQTVNGIRQNDLVLCTALLGAFMEQQEIDIPLMRSPKDHSKALQLSGKASVGVWALSSLKLLDLQQILKQCNGDQQLIIKIESYIKAIISAHTISAKPEDDQYAAKLHFIVQGMKRSVTCNTQYISYSLERQLADLCRDRNITESFPLERLSKQWDILFDGNILSLVALSHRPLLSRWLKWALMVHKLREKLAEYTAVGIVGLVNSGKSRLVSNLFGIQIPSGTTEANRTTIPFVYNMEDELEGLDVVDFPGVDDRDETISDLANLLLTLAQIIIFVVDYRKVHTESCKKWLERLQVEQVPILVCLTFADKLYAEHMSNEGKDPDKIFMKHEVDHQLKLIREKLSLPHTHQVKFFSFNQDKDSVLNCEEGREKLRNVGIGTPQNVGDWLVDTFKRKFGQEDLATRLNSFIYSDS